MTDHDELFKELIDTFLFDFLILFLPASITDDLDCSYRVELDRELPAALGPGRARRADLVYRIRNSRNDQFVVHIEVESSWDPVFPKRMLYYYVMLGEKLNLPILPIAILSFRSPQRRIDPSLNLGIEKLNFLRFNYVAAQLNRYYWRDFLHSENPVAVAMMSVMKYSEAELPEVRLESLRRLRLLKQPAASTSVAYRFIDAYTPLTTPSQKKEFAEKLANIDPSLREGIMTYITSWQREGIEIGRVEGKAEGKAEGMAEGRVEGMLEHAQQTAIRLITKRFGAMDTELSEKIIALPQSRLDLLPEAIFDFNSFEELLAWIDASPADE